jgi:MoxR-like ATPase
LRLARAEAAEIAREKTSPVHIMSQEQIFQARQQVLEMHMAEPLEQYLIQLVLATRNPGAYGEDLARWVQYGGSPRATISLDRAARAHAWLAGRDFVSPEDIQAIAPDVLRHRLILNYEAEADGVTTDQVITALLERVAVP